MFLTLLMIQPLTACSRSGGGQVEGKLRTPTDHELPRGFPAGGFAMSTLGIKERQDGRPPDLTTPRGRHATAALVPGARLMSHARRGRKSAWLRIQARSCLWIPGRGETNIGMQMVATRRGEMASAITIGRSVGVHDFPTSALMGRGWSKG